MEEKNSEEFLKKSGRDVSIKEGSFASAMDGFGLRFITPYALALGAGTKQIGILSSVPTLSGNIAQLFTLKLMRKGSRRSIVFWSVFLQALMWLPVISIGMLYFFYGWSSNIIVTALIIVYTFLVFVGSIAGPAWGSWMKDLVNIKSGEFFGRRNRIAGTVVLVSMITAGLILDFFQPAHVFFAFVIIFTFALCGKMVSAYYFTKQYEPKFRYLPEAHFSFRQFLKKMLFNNFGRFVLLLSFVSFATAIASPFFAVYMLKEIGFSYLFFTIVTFSSVLGVLFFMPLWGRFSDRHGNVVVIKLTGLLISFVPFLWFFSSYLPANPALIVIYLVLVEGFSGFAWAGFDLAASNFIYDAVTVERFAICSAYLNIINATGAFVGAMLGGFIASFSFNLFSLSSLLIVFILSGILRLAFSFVTWFVLREVRQVEEFKLRKYAKSILISRFDRND